MIVVSLYSIHKILHTKPNDYYYIGHNEDSSGDEKIHDSADITERRRSESDPVNLSLGYRDRDDDSNDGHIDVETIGNAPSKVSIKHLICTKRNRY